MGNPIAKQKKIFSRNSESLKVKEENGQQKMIWYGGV